MIYVFTHTDLDGVGAAAAYLLVRGLHVSDASISFVEPYNLAETLEQYYEYIENGDTIAIMDLGQPGRYWGSTLEAINKLRRGNAVIEWYDHHVWEPSDVRRLSDLGVHVFVDRTTCATGVVVKYAQKLYGRPEKRIQYYLEELESSICAADLWRWDHPLAPKLFRVVSLHGAKGDARRRFILNKLVSMKLWDEELEELLVEYVDVELANYEKIVRRTVLVEDNVCRIAGVVKPRGPPSNSFVGAYLLSRFSADIAVIIRENGGLSLRSRYVDVQKIARRLGGGGHPRAAGAKIELGLIDNILKRILPSFFTSRILKRILGEAITLSVCRQSSL